MERLEENSERGEQVIPGRCDQRKSKELVGRKTGRNYGSMYHQRSGPYEGVMRNLTIKEEYEVSIQIQ